MLRIYIEIYLFVLISVVLFMHCTYMFAYFIYMVSVKKNLVEIYDQGALIHAA